MSESAYYEARPAFCSICSRRLIPAPCKDGFVGYYGCCKQGAVFYLTFAPDYVEGVVADRLRGPVFAGMGRALGLGWKTGRALPWPTHPDGTTKTIGEMTDEERDQLIPPESKP